MSEQQQFYPKRFGRLFQIHPNYPGTETMRENVIEALSYEVATPYDHANLRLARAVKGPDSIQRWINVKFLDLGPWLGHAQPYNISLSVHLEGDGLISMAHHEFGHIFAMWVLTTIEKQYYMANKAINGGWPAADEQFALDMEKWMKSDPKYRWMDPMMMGTELVPK